MERLRSLDHSAIVPENKELEKFIQWKNRIENIDPKTDGSLETFLDTLKDMPLDDCIEESTKYAVSLTDKYKNDHETPYTPSSKGKLWLGLDEISFYQLVLESFNEALAKSNSDEKKSKLFNILLERSTNWFRSSYGIKKSGDQSHQEQDGGRTGRLVEVDVSTKNAQADQEEIKELEFNIYFSQYFDPYEDRDTGYFLLKDLVTQTKNFGSKESIPLLLKVSSYTPSYQMTRELTKVLSEIDPTEAAKQLLEELRNKEEELIFSENHSRILYLLELGRIGVDEGVVNYFDLQFELQGKEKEKIKIANRITGDGKVGLFGENDELVGYFELGDLSDPEKRRQAQILGVARELLFADPDTNDDVRQRFMKDYLKFYNDAFFQETGVYFNNLSLREQLWFFEYMSKTDDETKHRAQAVVKEHGEPALKCFIALESGEQAGEDIFKLADSNLKPEIKNGVFRAYGEVIDVLGNLDEEVREFFTEEKSIEELGRFNVSSEVAKRGARLLSEFAQLSEGKKSEDEIKNKLKNFRSDVVVFASIFKSVFRKEGIDFSKIKGLDFEIKTNSFTPEEIFDMETIVRKNYEGSSLVEGVVSGLKKATEKDNNQFFVLKRNEKIISFYRLERVIDSKDGRPTVEFASFNTNPDYQKSSLGRSVMQQGLEMAARDNTVVAQADPKSAVCQYYIEKANFSIVGLSEYKGTGITVFNLERDDTEQKIPIGEVVNLGQADEVVSSVKKYLDQGNILVRYFKEGGHFYGILGELYESEVEKEKSVG